MKHSENQTGQYYDIGVDIGGTNTVFALIDDQGQIYAKRSFPTMEPGDYNRFTERLAHELSLLGDNAGWHVRGIGIGAPCGNTLTGEIESPVHLGWGKVNLVESLEKKLDFGRRHAYPPRIRVTNDANAAALGEKAYGAAKDFTDFIEITLGTGVGSGIFVDNKLVVGANGLAGELGHIRYAACGDRACGCGRKGCLDAWCSAKGVVTTTRQLLAEGRESQLKEKADTMTSYDVFLAASEGDELAREVFELTGQVLGSAIADMVTFSDPQAVILFGGLAQSGALLLEPTRKAFEENVLPMFSGIKIILSTIPEGDAAILGAAACAKV